VTLYEIIRDLATIGAAGSKGVFVHKSHAEKFRLAGLEGVIEPIDELGLCWRLTERGEAWMGQMMDITSAAIAVGKGKDSK